jgi:hypothetical protein
MKRTYNISKFALESRKEKHRATIAKKKQNGEKLGRLPASAGGQYLKSGEYKACPVCNIKLVYHAPKDLRTNKRKTCSRECLFNDEVYKKKLASMDKSYMQTEEYKNSQRNPKIVGYAKYSGKVRKLTEKTYSKYMNEINPNGYVRSVCGTPGGYQLDHKMSIKECWNNDIPEEIAAGKDNLQIIPWKENLNKRDYTPPKRKR